MPFRRSLSGLALAVSLTASFACGGDDDGGTAPDNAHVGTFALVSINGQNLPFSLTDGTATITITSGSVVLNADLSFRDDFAYTVQQGTSTESLTETALGTYIRSGTNITFNATSPAPGSYRMAFGENTLTQAGEGFTFVYRR
jgi:hypothetical protein